MLQLNSTLTIMIYKRLRSSWYYF